MDENFPQQMLILIIDDDNDDETMDNSDERVWGTMLIDYLNKMKDETLLAEDNKIFF